VSEPVDPTKPVFKELTGRIDKYEIVRPLGKGAMGQVYLAHDTVLDRDVALKVMAAQIADDPELKQRFEREAKAIAKMQHPNLVTVFDLGNLTDGSPYIAMELLKGQDLQKSVRQPPPMTLERKVSVIVQVLVGLAHAHQRGIVHRDIKPANIFIQEDGSVKIMDFGVARLTTASMTGTGNIVGTADYMSPEQVKGAKVDGRSDLFSVGCMLFELAAGRRPFHSDNLMAIFYKITHEEANFDLIPQGADHDALMPILKKALAKDIDARYQTAYEFAVDLREWLRANATTTSSQNVLDQLVDLEAPTHAPMPMTEAPGVPFGTEEGGATVDLGTVRSGMTRRTLAPTRVGGRTIAEARAGATMRTGPTRVIQAPPVLRPSPRPHVVQKPSILPWVAVVLALAAVGGTGYLVWKSQQAPPVAEAPPATEPVAAATPTPPPPPVTAAPQPTFEEAAGKAAAQVKSAQAAFRAGSYDRAAEAAQAALREDAENATAKKILAQALVGQKAAAQVRAAEAALARGDLAAADRGLSEALRIAPWDPGAVSLSRRLDEARVRTQREAESQKQQQRMAQINAALNQAANALQGKQYEAAIAAYDQVLAIDPGNQAAQTGKQAAIGAKSMADAAASGARAGGAVRTFVAGRTQKQSGQPRAGAVPEGFEQTAGVNVKQGTQAAELPGEIAFEAQPSSPKPGDSYRVSAYLVNSGLQPIQLASMLVTTTVDGGARRGPVPPVTTTVAPRQRALVYQMPQAELWKEGTTSWSMEIVLTTANRDTYRNTLEWK
jgi:tRNA A-37 threonylcarbamoyl transferase component Bud32/tetratricopeptide (TPR) repeat protein